MSSESTYLVAGSRPWSRRAFDEVIVDYPGVWHMVSEPRELTAELAGDLAPSYIFFLHWSWKVPGQIFGEYECVGFHMTDVPYGRGGSPLQNLIMRGHKKTKLTALRMVEEFDAGPVYFKEDLSLHGSAEEIYLRASYLSAQLIGRIVRDQPEPIPQVGEATFFRRRRPQESSIPPVLSLQELHDLIRMLDADGYPHAFLEHEGFAYEFRRSRVHAGGIEATVSIKPADNGGTN